MYQKRKTRKSRFPEQNFPVFFDFFSCFLYIVIQFPKKWNFIFYHKFNTLPLTFAAWTDTLKKSATFVILTLLFSIDSLHFKTKSSSGIKKAAANSFASYSCWLCVKSRWHTTPGVNVPPSSNKCKKRWHNSCATENSIHIFTVNSHDIIPPFPHIVCYILYIILENQ